MQTANERCIDITVINDYYHNEDDQYWATSMDNECAIFVPNRSSSVISNKGADIRYVWANIDNLFV